uniref:Uncharacterized protein n=1 Tax=Cacopsylla melanoneura TaxID=428564 RepID=A0A8D9AL44_9HEMI
MEDPIIMSASNSLDSQQKDISPFESEACENYLKGFKLNIEELVPPPSEPKEPKTEPEENASEASTTPNKVQSRRPTLEINGVQVKPKTLAEYREAIKRKSLDGKTSDESRRKSLESKGFDSNRRKSLDKSSEENKRKSLDGKRLEDLKRKSVDSKGSEENINDENKSRLKSVRRHTIETPPVSEKKNVKVLGEHCNKKVSRGDSHKVSKVKDEAVISQENTITRSGRVSKKVLKTESVKEKHKKQEEEEEEGTGLYNV